VPTPFAEYDPNWSLMEKLAAKYRHIETLLIIGHGGSINTFRGLYAAFNNTHTPRRIIVDTNEPAYLEKMRALIDPAKTLLLAISKSGENTSQVESLLYFFDLPHKIFITGPSGVLRDMAKKDRKIDVIDHPDIGGRFTSFTEVALFPSLICGFDAHRIRTVLALSHSHVRNRAWEIANSLWALEQSGIDNVLLSVYTQALRGFDLFVQQLIHETIGKNKLGLTIIPLESPESQHHTSQRLFGGKRDTAVIFVTANQADLRVLVPKKFEDIVLRGKTLAQFENMNLAFSLEAEYIGTRNRADELGIPNLTINFEAIDEETAGAYIYFWQMLAVYSAHLRKVNAFDQPAVEASKDISFRERFK